jgi:hypothetical protein
VSPVRYELGFLSQKMAFFIVTTMKTSNLTLHAEDRERIQYFVYVMSLLRRKDLRRPIPSERGKEGIYTLWIISVHTF